MLLYEYNIEYNMASDSKSSTNIPLNAKGRQRRNSDHLLIKEFDFRKTFPSLYFCYWINVVYILITFRRWNTLKIVWILDSFKSSKINQNCPISLPFKSPATDFLFRIKKYSNFPALLMLWNAGHLLIKEFAGAKSIAAILLSNVECGLLD